MKTNYILADIFDALQSIQYSLVRMSGGKGSKPKPYSRPNEKRKQRIGHGKQNTMPKEELRKWLFRKNKGA